MKDAKGHGSNPHGAHTAGIDAAIPHAPQWGKSPIANAREAVRFITESGYPAQIIRKPGSSIAAIRSNTDGIIYINVSNLFWKDPIAVAERHGASGQQASGSPEHILNHEMGHAIYDPPDNFFTLVHQDLARTHVSKYAATNPKEFVSEVHAGMKAGKVYPEEVMVQFRQYARPRTKG